MKICKKCNKKLPLTDFYANTEYKDGYIGICKSCHSFEAKKRYSVNKEIIKEKSKKWYKKNRESALERIKSSYDYEKKREYDIVYKKKLEVIIRNMYLWIGYRIKKDDTYKKRKLFFTFEEFKKIAEKSDSLIRIYKNWVKGGFKYKYRPTLDRINNDKNYTLKNIQFITGSENSKKRWKDYKKDKLI